jgi:hypothetical protein
MPRPPLLSDRARTDRLIGIRVIRQRLLIERAPLQLITVIDEAVPHRVVGGPAVMAEQLDCLVETARLPNVTVFSALHTAAPTCKAAGGTPTDLTQGSVYVDEVAETFGT